MEERAAHNGLAEGSIPSGPTNPRLRWYQYLAIAAAVILTLVSVIGSRVRLPQGVL